MAEEDEVEPGENEGSAQDPSRYPKIGGREDESSLGSGGTKTSPLGWLALLSVTVVLAAILVPNFLRARAQGRMTPCLSNLKNIGTAMEMYSTDWFGKYPPALDDRAKHYLTPNYLKTFPECNGAGKDSYRMQLGPSAPYNTQSYEDYYFIECHGENHTAISVPAGYPQYNGIVGLIHR